MNNFPRRTPGRSLRTILIIWFVLLSVVPLLFLTFYTIFKFEKAIDNELAQRLLNNGREVESILNDFQASLKKKRILYTADNAFKYSLSINNSQSISETISNWLHSDFSNGITIFERSGRMLASAFKDETGAVRTFIPPSGEEVYLKPESQQNLKAAANIFYLEFGQPGRIVLVSLSRILSNNKLVGYIEQTIDIDKNFINKLKARMGLELIFLQKDGQPQLASHGDFLLYKEGTFANFIAAGNPLLNLDLRGTPFGFVLYKSSWGTSSYYIGVGSNKNPTRTALDNVKYAFFSVVGAIVILLIITIFVASNIFLKPLYELLEAIQSMHDTEAAIEIPIKNDTEIGLLTASFNEMSRKIAQAQKDLKKKISELEKANMEIKEAQTQLVQSAKMASLGQLVAGVAHELNNPIGFIYSNMSALKDYADKLFQLIEIAEHNPEQLSAAKLELELDYIKNDLPKLVNSCQDGARRTKDIVLGLRNFSRLQQAQLKEVNLEEALDTTVDLLSGELKNKVTLHKDFNKIPLVTCYASQINQVFMNIISNAVQAIEGSGQIWLATKALKGPDGNFNRVAIFIQDSGKGISSDNLEKIFDPFFTTKEVGVGTGLGLSISYGIIRNHGGEIQVKSQLGIGTEFTIILPIKPKLS